MNYEENARGRHKITKKLSRDLKGNKSVKNKEKAA